MENNNKKNNRGFTLIELLVVIAIISILASVVLASLSTARTKGKTAAIESVMSSLRAQAEIGAINGKYIPNLCKSTAIDGGLWPLLKSIDPVTSTSKAKRLICRQNIVFSEVSRPTAWGAQIDLPTSPVTTFCVDSTGYAGVLILSGSEIPGEVVRISDDTTVGVKCLK